MRTLSYANSECNFKSVGPIITDVCRIAAGTTLHLILSIIQGTIDFGFSLVRSAGHPSSKDCVGRFCGLNSISIGAVYAVKILALDRVLILHWNVYKDSDRLYFSFGLHFVNLFFIGARKNRDW